MSGQKCEQLLLSSDVVTLQRFPAIPRPLVQRYQGLCCHSQLSACKILEALRHEPLVDFKTKVGTVAKDGPGKILHLVWIIRSCLI